MLIIVARFNEDINWTKEFSNVLIVNKGNKIDDIDNQIFYPNVGREGHTIYKYIVDNYDNLDDYLIFLQGYPFDHSPNIIEQLHNITNDYNNNNNLDKYNFFYLSHYMHYKSVYDETVTYPQNVNMFDTIYKIFGKKGDNFPCIFGAGAQFMVSKQFILNRTKSFYENIVKLLDYDICPNEGYDIERLHYYIFNKTNEYE